MGEKQFTVGIRNPNGNAGSYIAKLHIPAGCVSTSGSYEQYFEQNGKRYHHILDPETGYPVDNGLISVTVISESGLLSDALSTACYVLGKDKGFDLLEKYNAYGVFVDKEQNIYLSDELKDNFRLKDSSFKVAE